MAVNVEPTGIHECSFERVRRSPIPRLFPNPTPGHEKSPLKFRRRRLPKFRTQIEWCKNNSTAFSKCPKSTIKQCEVTIMMMTLLNPCSLTNDRKQTLSAHAPQQPRKLTMARVSPAARQTIGTWSMTNIGDVGLSRRRAE